MNTVVRAPKIKRATRGRWSLGLLALSVLALALLAGCGDATTDSDTAASAESESAMSEHDDHMDHALYEVPDGAVAPTINIEVEPDPVSGANLYIDVSNFDIAPEHASTETVPGEGHFHVYVDGEKVSRFYNPDMHLGLTPGDHTVMVEISANDHSPYAVDGEPITAITTVTVPEPAAMHKHADPVEAGQPQPTIALSATVDPKAGWNLFADVENFTFAPRQAGFDPIDGEGHMHLYVDGEKVTRLYGPWWHLKGLTAGSHDVTVELTANNHAPMAVNGEIIASTVTIDVSESQAGSTPTENAGDDHDHSEMEGMGVTLLDMAATEADVVIELTITDGKVAIDNNRFEVSEGQTVGIIASSDQADELHVHGFEVLQPIDHGTTVDVAFTADQSGVFEVELEDAGLFLFEILVR